MAKISKVRSIKLLKPGIETALKSAEMDNTLQLVAKEIVRDVRTMSGEEHYEFQRHNIRSTRTVYNIISTRPDAMVFEAEFGFLARAARKERGEV